MNNVLKTLAAGVAVVAALASVPSPADAQPQSGNNSNGECQALCGTPLQSGGGGCGCGCGCSILVNRTDLEIWYQYADDFDNDGWADEHDVCPFEADFDQVDSDGDMVGDVCDNCQRMGNVDQLDIDGDTLGDLCDDDMDGDEVANVEDMCERVANPVQTDTDGDSLGDACDDDMDDDGVDNLADNCPLGYNPNQEAPTAATVCDTDLDQDGVMDSRDICPTVYDQNQLDTDLDLAGDACDPDDDDDSLADARDNCPVLANPDQFDPDRDGIGQDCDSRFCYMVGGPEAGGDEENCLDPEATLTAFTPGLLVDTGEKVTPGLWVNRENAPMRFRWELTQRPDGSEATIDNPEGAVRLSTPYQYHYLDGNIPTFMADEPGQYRIRLTVELAFEDEQYPEVRTAQYETVIEAQGSSMGSGCSTNGAPIGSAAGAGILAALAGLALSFRRRK